MNSNIVNALKREDRIKKTTKFMTYLFTEIIIISWYTKVSKRLCEKKNQGNKIKDSGEAYDIN